LAFNLAQLSGSALHWAENSMRNRGACLAMAHGHARLAAARPSRRCRPRGLATRGLGGPGRHGGLIWGVGRERGSLGLAVHGGVRATRVLNGGRPEGRLLAPEEMSVSSRTLAGAGGGGGRVVWCWRRPVCGVVPGGGGHQRRWRPRTIFGRHWEQSTRTTWLETIQGA
jgi:hypothetical protein